MITAEQLTLIKNRLAVDVEGQMLVGKIEDLSHVMSEIIAIADQYHFSGTMPANNFVKSTFQCLNVLTKNNSSRASEQLFSSDKPIRFKPKENIHWEDWGRLGQVPVSV